MGQQTGSKLPPTPHPLARCLGVLGILFLTLSDVPVPASISSVGLATTVAIFARNGYGMAVYSGEEMHDAHAKIAAYYRVVLRRRGVWTVRDPVGA